MVEKYISRGRNDLSLPQRIMKFISDKSQVEQQGQGVITVGCTELWDMSEEEFQKVFGIHLRGKK